MTNYSYRWLFWLLTLVGFSADQVSKYGVFAWLYDEDRLSGNFEVIAGAFDIVARHTPEKELGQAPLSFLRSLSGNHLPEVNQGALFGTKLLFSPSSANVVFGIVSVLVALGIIYWSTRTGMTRDGYLSSALGLILGGTLGNLYDRLVFNGVRDFLWWHKGIDWPVFNIADCCLVCGAGLLILEAFFAHNSPTSRPNEVAAVAKANSINDG